MTKVGYGRALHKKNRKRRFRPDAVCLSLNLFKQSISSTVKMGNGRAPYGSKGTRKKNCKRSFRLIGQAPRQDLKLINNNNAVGLLTTPIASPQHPSTMENLPEELLLDIFTRLLAKQLAQMRSVSKSWNALLSQSSFVKSHLHRSLHNTDQVLLLFNPRACPCDSKPFTAHPSRSPHLELTEFNKLPPVNPESGHHIVPSGTTEENDFFSFLVNIIRVIGAVNGLICSFYGNLVIHIWNPSMSAVSTLPPFLIPLHCGSEVNFRFGFDPKTDDYKVVKLTGIPIMEQPSEDGLIHFLRYTVKKWLQVEVYSMRKGFWELITSRFPSHIERIFDEDSICVDGHDGHLHWLGLSFGGKTYSKTIVAFDLGSHTFSEIPLPDSILYRHISCDGIGVSAGKLCVMSRAENDACEVWVMDEYGVVESWVKRHVFSQFNYYKFPFGFTSHNEFLIDIDDNGSRLVLYDPIANKTKSFDKFCCGERGGYPHKIVEYVDSLVWVAPLEH